MIYNSEKGFFQSYGKIDIDKINQCEHLSTIWEANLNDDGLLDYIAQREKNLKRELKYINMDLEDLEEYKNNLKDKNDNSN